MKGRITGPQICPCGAEMRKRQIDKKLYWECPWCGRRKRDKVDAHKEKLLLDRGTLEEWTRGMLRSLHRVQILSVMTPGCPTLSV